MHTDMEQVTGKLATLRSMMNSFESSVGSFHPNNALLTPIPLAAAELFPVTSDQEALVLRGRNR